MNKGRISGGRRWLQKHPIVVAPAPWPGPRDVGSCALVGGDVTTHHVRPD